MSPNKPVSQTSHDYSDLQLSQYMLPEATVRVYYVSRAHNVNTSAEPLEQSSSTHKSQVLVLVNNQLDAQNLVL